MEESKSLYSTEVQRTVECRVGNERKNQVEGKKNQTFGRTVVFTYTYIPRRND